MCKSVLQLSAEYNPISNFTMSTKNSMYIIIALLMMVICSASSCSEDNYGNDVENVSFSLSLPSESTRAMGEGLNADLLHYYVYRKDGETLQYLDGKSGTVNIVGFKADLSLSLVKGWNYKIVFWADKDGNSFYSYDAETHVMGINYDGAVGQDDSRDAFYEMEDISLSGPVRRNLTLTRPFAQINVGTDDVQAAQEKGISVTQTGMTVKGVYDKLNLVTGEVEGEPIKVEFGMGDIPGSGETFPFSGGEDAGSETTPKSYDYLAMNYVLTDKERSTINVSVTTDNANVKPIEVTQVPVERNWRTNIYGSLLTDGNVGTEIIPDNLIEISTADELKDALARGDSVKLADQLTIELTGAKDSLVVSKSCYINLNGKTLTVTRTGVSSLSCLGAIVIPTEGTSLTVANGILDLSKAGDIKLKTSKTSIKVEGLTLEFPKGCRSYGMRQMANVIDAKIEIVNSNLHGAHFCVHTDASDPKLNTEITIQNSVLSVAIYAAVLNCVNGKVNISDSQLYGVTQGLIMRCGTAEIKNTLIQIDTDKWGATGNLYSDKWGVDMRVPFAAVVIGNNDPNNYQYPTDITFLNDTLTVIGKHIDLKISENVYKAYAAHLYSNITEGLRVTFRYDSLTQFKPYGFYKDGNPNYITEIKL